MPDTENKNNEEMPAQAPIWKDSVFRAAMYVGLGLLITGLVSYQVHLMPLVMSALIICSALGIILGAFGAVAVVRYKGLTVAGVAAVAIALLLVVEYVGRDHIVRLKVEGDVRGARVSLVGDRTYPGADQQHFFEFIIGREIDTEERLTLYVEAPGPNGDASEIQFRCLPSQAISDYLGSGKNPRWTFDAQKAVLTGVNGVPDGRVESGPCVAPPPKRALVQGSSLIKTAFAQDLGSKRVHLDDLESDSVVVRRSARTALSRAGVSAVPDLLKRWKEKPDNYRVKLGALVSLEELIRDRPEQRQVIASQISREDLELIAKARTDADRTVQYYATSFLTQLADPRMKAVRLAPKP